MHFIEYLRKTGIFLVVKTFKKKLVIYTVSDNTRILSIDVEVVPREIFKWIIIVK